MAYMEMFGNCAHSNDNEYLRHSVHMVQQQWQNQKSLDSGLTTTQSCSFMQSSSHTLQHSTLHLPSVDHKYVYTKIQFILLFLTRLFSVIYTHIRLRQDHPRLSHQIIIITVYLLRCLQRDHVRVRLNRTLRPLPLRLRL